MAKRFDKAVAIMRANPPHINHTGMLRELCDVSGFVNVNLGSSNKFNKKNPFKVQEREDMMRLALSDYSNFEIFRLPDVGNDEEWFASLCKINSGFTQVMSNNDYDLRIYKAHQYTPGHEGELAHKKYDIISPTDVFPREKIVYAKGILEDGVMWKQARKPIYTSGTFVRAAMVNDWNWQDFVDPKVVEYIEKNGLVDRVKTLCSELKGITLEQIDDGR